MNKHTYLFLALLFSIYTQAQNTFEIKIRSYQRHCEITWDVKEAKSFEFHTNHDALDPTIFEKKGSTKNNYFLYFTDNTKLDNYQFFVKALNDKNEVIATSNFAQVQEYEMTDEELQDMVQRNTFRYFYDDAHPSSGMARERNKSGDIVTSGGTGFGIMSILVAVENGYITREEGLNRLIKIASFLQFADRFHGVFPHWMNGTNGDVYPFSQFDNGGDLVETAFLMEGLLTAREFFDQDTPLEKALRKIITKLWEEVDFDFYSKNNSGVLYWHWSPQHEWKMNFPVRGYNEGLIIYLLGIASPIHAVTPSYWKTGWTQNNNYKNGLNYFGIKLPVGPAYGGPLFFAHYSYIGFDPRGIKDQFTNYYTQNVKHSLINHAYCKANPLKYKEYSGECWGLTASDTPGGYKAHEPYNDNGTISPTAALSSMPYTPKESMDALKYFYLTRGESLFTYYGFVDAFNPSKNWVADSYLAIDQGPIICMIQNHRTQLLWKYFMKNPEIQKALDKIGFVKDNTPTYETDESFDLEIENSLGTSFEIKNKESLNYDMEIFTSQGQLIKTYNNQNSNLRFGEELIPSMYFIKVTVGSKSKIIKIVKI